MALSVGSVYSSFIFWCKLCVEADSVGKNMSPGCFGHIAGRTLNKYHKIVTRSNKLSGGAWSLPRWLIVARRGVTALSGVRTKRHVLFLLNRVESDPHRTRIVPGT